MNIFGMIVGLAIAMLIAFTTVLVVTLTFWGNHAPDWWVGVAGFYGFVLGSVGAAIGSSRL